jgi:ketosteroid isomerase-like protein
MSQNTDLVRRLFKAVEARDAEAAFACYDAEVEIQEAPSLPYGGVYYGPEGAANHASGYIQTWGAYQGEVERSLTPTILDVEQDQVLVLWRQRAVDPSNHETLDLPAASIYKVRGGRVIRSQMFQDTASIKRFLDSPHRP